MATIETACLCGAVGLRLSGDPAVQLYCHCNDCQAAHSAAYISAAVFPREAVEVVRGAPIPKIVTFTQRMRCPECATHLFSELANAGMRSVNAYLLPEGVFRPQFHVQCQHAVLPVVDSLPHYHDFPAAFGGTDRLASW